MQELISKSVILKSPCSENQVFFMLFICLWGVFNMLLDKPCANPLINTIVEYFLLKTVVSQKADPDTWFETAFGLLHHKIQQPITSRDRFLSASCKIYQYSRARIGITNGCIESKRHFRTQHHQVSNFKWMLQWILLLSASKNSFISHYPCLPLFRVQWIRGLYHEAGLAG